MLPALTWLSYALVSYILWSIYFRLRYHHSPIANAFPPRTRYAAIDFALAICLITYSAWIALGPPPDPMWNGAGTWAGLAVFLIGAALRLWAILTLGPHWRIGQDERDTNTQYVATGPYRLMHHPINVALVLVAIGQTFMTGLNPRSLFLLAFSTAYLLIQARAEEQHWAARRAGSPSPREVVGGRVGDSAP